MHEPSGRHAAPTGSPPQSTIARMTQSPDTPSEHASAQKAPLTFTAFLPGWQPFASETMLGSDGSVLFVLKNFSETTNSSPALTGIEIGTVWFSSSYRNSLSPPSCSAGPRKASFTGPGFGKVPPS